jgi:hypothetical protein
MGTRDALVSDRPDFTESASTIAPHHVQVEAGQTTSREGDTRSNAVGEVLVRAGLTSRLELRVSGNSWVHERQPELVHSGLEDGAIGIKYRIADGPDAPSWRPTFSVIAHTTLPTGSDAFRAARAQPEVKLLGAWTLSDRLGFSSNVNIGRPFDGARSYTEIAASASLGAALSERVGAYAETFGFAPQDGTGTISRFANAGVTFLFSPDVQLDVRAGVGPATQRTRDYFAGVGLVVRR